MSSIAARGNRSRSRARRRAAAAAATLTAFSAAAVGAGAGRALVTTYLPVLLADIRDAPGLIGTVMLVNAAAGFAVPLWIGLWSDRLHARGRSRTGPFILGGSIVAAGGLAAIALGHATSYLFLALAAAVAYTGLNAITTAHRALIPETFADRGGAPATGAEEFAMLTGTVAGVVAGGFLIEVESWAPFVLGAALLPLLALPTFVRMRGRERSQLREPRDRRPLAYYVRAARAPGVRLVLTAQLLWVLGYIGLPPFFVLYAEHELDLRPGLAGTLLAVFGVVTGLAVLGAGAIASAFQHRMALLGVLLLGGGLLAASATTVLRFAAPGLLAAAVGFGLVTTLGFPLLTRFIPAGEEGAYTALFFSVRAVAAAVALPAAGWTISAADSYRAVLVAGGAVALCALAPLAAVAGPELGLRPPRPARVAALGGALVAISAAMLALGWASATTRLAQVDADLFDALYELGGTPRIVDRLLVDPHIHNYVGLTLVAALAAILWRPAELVRVLAVVPLAGLVSFGVVRALWLAWDRARPEEVLSIEPANGHLWAPYPSFPSGHVAVTVALVTAIASRIPWLGLPLAGYAAVISVTRVSYGAHFPVDVLAGVVLGFATARILVALLTETRLLPLAGPRLRAPVVATRAASGLRFLGLGLGAAAVVALTSLAATIGAPQSPDGGIIPGPTEDAAQYALLAASAVALAVGVWRPAIGGAALLLGSTAMGMLAALEYNPLFAAGACIALFVPGLLLLLGSSAARSSRGVVVVTAGALALLIAGSVGAFRLHAAAFGPTHPESTTRGLPVTIVRWAWAGGVTETGFRVVAKLAFDADARLVVSEDPDFAGYRVTTSGAHASHDENDRIVSFDVRGLTPGRRYYYAVQAGGVLDRARAGRVVTFPRGPTSFTVAVGGCARVGSNGAVFDAIRAERPRFFLILGDFFYANIGENDPEAFRNQFDRALTRPAQAALYRSTPVAYVWDDHDFGPDDADSSSPTRPAALATYRQAVPHYPLAGDGSIAQSFVVGRVRFVITDARSARTDTTMLGARQEAWLKRELLRAQHLGQLAVWVTSVPWIASEGADSWAGYPDERRELANFIARFRIRNLLLLAGDAHMVAIDDGSNSDYSAVGGAGFPVMHAAALDRRRRLKGGPYSEGAVPGSGQYGTIKVRDSGGPSISVTLAGWNYRGERLVEYTFTRTLGEDAR